MKESDKRLGEELGLGQYPEADEEPLPADMMPREEEETVPQNKEPPEDEMPLDETDSGVQTGGSHIPKGEEPHLEEPKEEPKHIDYLRGIPQEIYDLRLNLIDGGEQRQMVRTELSAIENKVDALNRTLVGEDGKLLYTNEKMRDLALQASLESDEGYIRKTAELKLIDSAIAHDSASIELKENKFRAIKYIIKLYEVGREND